VHTPNGIILSSYKFPDSGQYVITVKILGINFMPVSPVHASFTTEVIDSNNKYLVEIIKMNFINLDNHKFLRRMYV
jgi:hypothetical protein